MLFNKKGNRNYKSNTMKKGLLALLGISMTMANPISNVTAIAEGNPMIVASVSSVKNSLSYRGKDKDTLVVFTTIPNIEEDTKLQREIEDEARLQKTLEQEIKEDIETERIDKIKDYVNSIVCDPNDVSRVTGLHPEDYKLLTKGTWWAGHEQALIDLEKYYHVNAMFAMSVSSLESGYGTSVRANSKNNYYGIELPTYWSGLYDNTLWWGKLIKKWYIGKRRKSVWVIGPVYCPPNREWEEFHYNMMYKLYNKLKVRLNKTYL